MGVYLNGISAYGLFQEDYSLTYYVDKSEMLAELVPLIERKTKESENGEGRRGKGLKYVAVTRPRRFGKTVMANMIASYFGKGVDSHEEFDTLKVSRYPWYRKHLNRHNVIHIAFNKNTEEIRTGDQYISMIRNTLLDDLRAAYPEVRISDTDSLWMALTKIYECCGGEKFIFVLDEWDYLYHQDFTTDRDKDNFTKFLSNLLKDSAYVEMAYMTGILPIAKYSSGSELNMFCEYTMVTEEKYSGYFGFTEKEVDELYDRYLKQDIPDRKVTREGLRFWYDGYHTKGGERIYNPRSVVLALENNNLGNYWTSSGPYDELFYYIGANVDSVKDDVGLLLSGIPVPAKVQEYAATSMELKTRDEIFSAMVVYGFLNYEDGCVSIPNKELMDKFAEMAQKEPSLGNVYRLTRESGRMLAATKAGDTKTMTEILQFVHNTESPLLVYNSEAELASVITLVYLQARDYYRIEREDRAGTGYVDFIFYPYRKDDDAIIIELKVNHPAEEAIQQIKDRQYALRFEGKIGEKPEYTGRILAVGIAYYKDDTSKKHECRVEVLRDRIH
ncbi:MAG TPA: ATP-binding protein [Candidatus Eisenbergiella merdipullorum]|uniref:ATP-binding protein n=1 Tax=Candidatus Eisenbergiella merdipullorum TaxID=2838553 RepID=A0A9D2L0I7_9FIRM|nr:ATP-binding protein [Candidatus Eisenbergiella merdipullorum]